jgi:hypothetical protein
LGDSREGAQKCKRSNWFHDVFEIRLKGRAVEKNLQFPVTILSFFLNSLIPSDLHPSKIASENAFRRSISHFWGWKGSVLDCLKGEN